MGSDSISERFRSLSTHPGSLYEKRKIESDPIFPEVNVFQGIKACEAAVGELEIREIHHYAPAGRTTYERKSNKARQHFWRQTTQTYSKELAAVVKAGLDAGLASGKFAVKKTEGAA